MVSQSRRVSSARPGSPSGARRNSRTTVLRTSASRHTGGGAHRSNGSGPRRPRGRGRHRVLKWLLGLVGLMLVCGIGFFAYMYTTTEVPQPEKIAMAAKTTVYYADGKTQMGSFAEQNREIIDCKALPSYIGNAIVSSENQSFYRDSGVDLRGIARALFNNITTGSRQGGSTITQQYAERYYLGDTHSYTGKLHEAFLALKITQTQSKSDILCNYMNTIYWGRGAYGIQAAAQAYFNKDAKDLTLSQAAMLAGIIPSPSRWDPAIEPKEATFRFHRVIRIMRDNNYIDAKQAKDAAMPTTISDRQQNSYSGPNGYLLQMVRSELTGDKAFTDDELDTGGYRITTTIQKPKQDEMYQVASPSQGGKGIVPSGLQVGSMSVNVKDGSIIALYGGDDYLAKQSKNTTHALYHPGSTTDPSTPLGPLQAVRRPHPPTVGTTPQ